MVTLDKAEQNVTITVSEFTNDPSVSKANL